TGLAGEASDLVRRVHRIVAADVEKITDVVSAEDIEDALVLIAVGGQIAELVAAGADGGRPRLAESLHGLGRVRAQVEEVFLDDAEDAVIRPIEFADARLPQGFLNDAASAGIDDRRRPTRLSDNRVPPECIHSNYLTAENAEGAKKKEKRRER